jgi:hypothetical protein
MATTSIGAPGVTFPDATVQASAGATGIPVLNVYTSSGTYTKPASVKAIAVTVVGGGGNGGPVTIPGAGSELWAVGSSGGCGGYSQKIYPAASLPGPQPYTVGAAASSSSFGAAPATVITATGGTSAGTATGGSGGANIGVLGAAGGSSSGGQINGFGLSGRPTWRSQPGATPAYSGEGGSNQFGVGGLSIQGGLPGSNTTTNGNAGTGYGSGGSGAHAARQVGGSYPTSPFSATGGAGATGVVIIEEFY